MAKLTHLDDQGQAQMVDVSAKPVTLREAVAEGYIVMAADTARAIAAGAVPKGEVLNTARVAGIMAAKRTGELIPMCHPLPLEHVQIDLQMPQVSADATAPVRIRIEATARITAKTGIEMEALTAVCLAALTIYDMCKSIDKQMVIEGIRLLRKSGGSKTM